MKNNQLVCHIETSIGMHDSDADFMNALACAKFDSVDDAARCLNRILISSYFFIYRGGSHVALHYKRNGSFHDGQTRVAIWKPIA